MYVYLSSVFTWGSVGISCDVLLYLERAESPHNQLSLEGSSLYDIMDAE